MERREFHIGPGATSLILVALVLCMSALSMLALVNARNDLHLSERSVEVVQRLNTLYNDAERAKARIDTMVACWDGADEEQALAEIAAMLPDNMTMEGRIVRWQEKSELGQILQCAVEIRSFTELPRVVWVDHALMNENVNVEPDSEWI